VPAAHSLDSGINDPYADPQGTPNVRVYVFDGEQYAHMIRTPGEKRLGNPLNYARNWLPSILPRCVKRTVYLDVDVVVKSDLRGLHDFDLNGKVVASPEFCQYKYEGYFSSRIFTNRSLHPPGTNWEDYGSPQRRNSCYFNPGVCLIDLVAWDKQGIAAHMEYWLLENKREKLWALGSLPPFLLEFSGRMPSVSPEWNSHDWGIIRKSEMVNCTPSIRQRLARAHIVHFSGAHKPWDFPRFPCNPDCPCDLFWRNGVVIGSYNSSALKRTAQLATGASSGGSPLGCGVVIADAEVLISGGRLCTKAAAPYIHPLAA
jgi:lipopolysaccharide biosynthesis glycosyltransferase